MRPESKPVMQQELDLGTECLRCKTPCQRGKPDPKARAIRRSATVGLCASCMFTNFLQSIEGLERTISEKGPEVLFGGGNDEFHTSLRQIVGRILYVTQMEEPEIDWIEVVSNWGMPWPKGHEPKPGWI